MPELVRGHTNAAAPSVGVQAAGAISKAQRPVAIDEDAVAGRFPARLQVGAQAGIARRLLPGGGVGSTQSARDYRAGLSNLRAKRRTAWAAFSALRASSTVGSSPG